MLISTTALFDSKLSSSLFHLSDELRWWMKPRSMAWFSDFLVRQYDRQRWIQHFRMSKESMFDLCSTLRPYIERRDTRYWCAIPVEIRVTAALYKLAHGVNILTCSEMFTIRHSTVGRAIREVVNTVKVVFRSQILWPQGGAASTSYEPLQNMVPHAWGCRSNRLYTHPHCQATDFIPRGLLLLQNEWIFHHCVSCCGLEEKVHRLGCRDAGLNKRFTYSMPQWFVCKCTTPPYSKRQAQSSARRLLPLSP
jgi:hypothetical protein